MSFESKRRISAIRAGRILATMLACCALSSHALAQEKNTKDNEAALRDLSARFSSRVGEKLDEADLFLKGAGRLELAEQRSGSFLPENEPIIMSALFGTEQIGSGQDLYTIKRDHRLLVSLADFSLAAQLAIKVIADKGTASGWARREDQTFNLDAINKKVEIAGVTYPIDSQDIALEGGDILVSTDKLEEWLHLSFDYNFSDLALLVNAKDPLPVEVAYARSQRRGTFSENGRAKLPYKKSRYGLVSLPYVDTDLFGAWSKSPNSPATRSGSWSSIITGDFAGFNTQGFVSGDNVKPYLDTVRITLGKEDADAGLLGPLHATSYQFGDVNTVSNPLIGGGALEKGVRVSNNPLDSSTADTFTQIRGNNQPGWDVELYRNDVYLDTRHIDSTGLYDFGNVDLIVGNNYFKLLFYGPQGQSREEHRTVRVDASTLGNKHGTYNVSLSQQNLSTWQRTKPTTPGTGALRASGRYEFGISNVGTASIGLRSNEDLGTRRTLAQTGIAANAFGTFFNADAGMDTSSGSAAATLTARRNFQRQSAFAQYTWNDKNFSATSPEGESSLKDSYRLGLSGPLFDKFSVIDRPSYSLSGTWNNLYDGSRQFSGSAGLTARIDPISISTNYNFNETDRSGTEGGGPTSKSSSLITTTRGRLWGGTWRTDTLYELKPKAKLSQSSFEYDRQLKSNLDGTAEITYIPDPKLTTLNLGLNWHTQKADIGPSLQYDNRHNLNIGLNIHFGLGADPYSYRYDMYNTYLSGGGGVAARIFMDKNGDGIYNPGDELLEGAELISMQTSDSALSDKNGIAYIPNIEKNRLTDIIVNPSSSADAYGYSMFEGVSLRAHPGAVTKLEFPIVDSGEMDGQSDYVYKDGTRKPAASVTMALISPDGKVQKSETVASDGYWALSTIRPGTYYLVAKSDEALAGYFPPRLVQFKPDGTTLYGQKVEISGDSRPVRFTFTSTNDPPDSPNHARTIVPADIAGQHTLVKLGGFHSRIALNFSWYKFQLQNPGWKNVFDLAIPVKDIQADPKTQEFVITLQPKKNLSPEQAGLACQDFQSVKFECNVDVITTYRGAPKAPKEKKSLAEAIASVVKMPVDAPPPTPMAAAAPVTQTQTQLPETARMAAAALTPQQDNTLAEAITKTQEPVRAYVAINKPGMNAGALNKTGARGKTVIMNLGSYNSRELMALTWFKIKKRYGAMIGDAHLIVQPADSYASIASGKHSLLATSTFDEAEAMRRCALLTGQGMYCTVDVIDGPEQQGMTATENGAPPT